LPMAKSNRRERMLIYFVEKMNRGAAHAVYFVNFL
jgi:hypothetical protein